MVYNLRRGIMLSEKGVTIYLEKQNQWQVLTVILLYCISLFLYLTSCFSVQAPLVNSVMGLLIYLLFAALVCVYSPTHAVLTISDEGYVRYRHGLKMFCPFRAQGCIYEFLTSSEFEERIRVSFRTRNQKAISVRIDWPIEKRTAEFNLFSKLLRAALAKIGETKPVSGKETEQRHGNEF